MSPEQRERFDRLLEDAIDALPPGVRSLLDVAPLVVLDRPTPEMIRQLRTDGLVDEGEDAEQAAEELCGLHTGTALTERSVQDSGILPDQIHIFREGIAKLALEDEEIGWDDPTADDYLYEEIRITLLHEIGHHFGLDEDDLEELGYG